MTVQSILTNFRSLVSRMLKEKGIEDYDIDVTGNSGIGDGYTGDVIFFKVSTKNDDKTLNLVMKLSKKNEALRIISNLDENFRREIFIYDTIFHSIQRYFSENKPEVKVLQYVPKLYWFCADCGNEALVFENLKAQGFSSWKKSQPLDFEHTIQVVRNIARWHGEVMAFRDQNPDVFNSWIPKLQNIRYEMYVQLGLMKHALKHYRNIVKILKDNGEKLLAAKFEAEEKNLDRHAQVAEDEKDRLVITHSDIWINNVLFKFPENSEIATENKYFDFQVSNVNTPVEDLAFFIYGHCDEDVLDRFDLIIEDYYDTLSETVNNLGSDIGKIFTFADLQRHWKKYGMFGVVSSIEIIKLQLLHDEEVTDVSTSAESELSTYFDFVMKNEELYVRRLVTLFKHFGNKYL